MYIVKSEVTEYSESYGRNTSAKYFATHGVARTLKEAKAYIKKLKEEKYYRNHLFDIETIEWIEDL
jgi:hypothetical protein